MCAFRQWHIHVAVLQPNPQAPQCRETYEAAISLIPYYKNSLPPPNSIEAEFLSWWRSEDPDSRSQVKKSSLILTPLNLNPESEDKRKKKDRLTKGWAVIQITLPSNKILLLLLCAYPQLDTRGAVHLILSEQPTFTVEFIKGLSTEVKSRLSPHGFWKTGNFQPQIWRVKNPEVQK